MDLPDVDEPTMNVISSAGRKMETLERTGMVGRDGYIKVALWSASSPVRLAGVLLEDSEVPGLRSGRGKGNEGNHREFPFGENDELGNIHLHVACCDKTRPGDSHHTPSKNLVLHDELRARSLGRTSLS